MKDPVGVGEEVVLGTGGRVRGGETADPADRSLQMEEAAFGDACRDLGPETAEHARFVGHDQSPVLRTEASIVSKSIGESERRSMTSMEVPSSWPMRAAWSAVATMGP